MIRVKREIVERIEKSDGVEAVLDKIAMDVFDNLADGTGLMCPGLSWINKVIYAVMTTGGRRVESGDIYVYDLS